MNSVLSLTAFFLLAFMVSEISGACCGRGKHGFCKDCARVGLFKHRKCCSAGSGHGHGCNIFCCNCGHCRTGFAVVKHISGWWVGAKYSCTQHIGDSDVSHPSAQDSWEAFNEIDLNGDNAISHSEFMDAVGKSLVDTKEAKYVASDLLNADDYATIASFLDAVANEDADNEVTEMLADEFRSMDVNKDGFIMAHEFDNEL